MQFSDVEGFTSCAGVKQPLRVLHTLETNRRLWRAGHGLWDIENDCFHTLNTHRGLDHCYKHDPTAIVNFTLTLCITYVLLQCFWRRNLEFPRRLTLIALARELERTLAGCRAP